MGTPSASNPWLGPRKINPQARLRLFCFPYGGGTPWVYRGWTKLLPPQLDVCPVHLPGRGLRLNEPSFRSLEPLVDALVQALTPHLDLPFAIFGHSVGSLIAYGLAHRLSHQEGRPPVHLFVSGRRGPQVPLRTRPIHALPHDEFLKELRTYNGTPEELLREKEFMDMLVPALRADFEINQTFTWSPRPPLGCPLSAFGGDRDPVAAPEDVEPWREMTGGAYKLRFFPGQHFYLNHPPQPEPLLRAIVEDLSAAKAL